MSIYTNICDGLVRFMGVSKGKIRWVQQFDGQRDMTQRETETQLRNKKDCCYQVDVLTCIGV